jgi:hypothetical protein
MVMPRSAQKNNRAKSFLVIPVFMGRIAYISQNKNAVVTIRTAVNAVGAISDGLMCFTAITLVPKKKFPVNTAILAFTFSFITINKLWPVVCGCCSTTRYRPQVKNQYLFPSI